MPNVGMGGNYAISVGVQLNTKDITNIQTTLQKLNMDAVSRVSKSFKDGTKSITTYKDALGNTVKAQQIFDANNKLISTSILSVKTNTDLAKSSVQRLGDDFVETTKKVFKFGLSTAVIGLFTGAIGEAISAVKDFDNALTEFKKVSDLSGEALDDYSEKLGKMGEEVARTRSEMLEASTAFRKSGFSDEESAQLSRVATMYQNVADSELSAGDASSFVISQMKAFGIEANNATQIIDKTNEVKLKGFVTSLNRVNCGKIVMMFIDYNVI